MCSDPADRQKDGGDNDDDGCVDDFAANAETRKRWVPKTVDSSQFTRTPCLAALYSEHVGVTIYSSSAGVE